jgi:(S)-ureidoglycine aminohydrolase
LFPLNNNFQVLYVFIKQLYTPIMKAFFLILMMVAASLCTIAQTDALHAGVYNYSDSKTQKIGVVEKRQLIAGKTLDLQTFEIYTLTLPTGKSYTPPLTDSKFEQLIIVKSGIIKLMLKDSVKTVGAGSLALVLAGDNIGFQNTSDQPATWYVIHYESKNPVNIQRGNDAGPSFIKDWNSLKVNKSPKGETRAVFDRATSMFGRFDVHATALNPGYASHDPHTHRVEELILMLNGSIQEQIAQDKFMTNAGDCIFLSSGILHGPKNISNEQCYYYAIQWHNLKTD